MSAEPVQTPMFPGDPSLIPPRPTRRDAAIMAGVARALAERFFRDPAFRGCDVEEMAKDIHEALESETDAYQIARHLERAGWWADASIVEALGDADGMLWDAGRAAVRTWVAEHAIAPKLAVGAAAWNLRCGANLSITRVEVTNEGAAAYEFAFPEEQLLKLRDGEWPGAKTTYPDLLPNEYLGGRPLAEEPPLIPDDVRRRLLWDLASYDTETPTGRAALVDAGLKRLREYEERLEAAVRAEVWRNSRAAEE